MLDEDHIAVNPSVAFSVESFSPTDNSKPEKPYATRLKWRDLDGNEQSKLLLTQPETVIAVVLRGEAKLRAARKGRPGRPGGYRLSRRGSRKIELVRLVVRRPEQPRRFPPAGLTFRSNSHGVV
jgi:hypothetical protein